MKKPRLPKELFIAYNTDDPKEPWLHCSRNTFSLIEDETPVEIGVYKLQKVMIGRKVVDLELKDK